MSAQVATEATRTPPTVITSFKTAAGEPLTFQWTRAMPEGGYLGNVTFRQFQKKPIQVFDPEPVYSHSILIGVSWAYQAQDGSFLCRVFVTEFLNAYVTFSDLKKGNWPVPLTVVPAA